MVMLALQCNSDSSAQAQDRISFQYARTNAHDARLIYHFSPRSLLPLAQLRTITAHVFFTFVCLKYQNTTASSSDRQHYRTLHHPVSGGEGGKSSQLQVAAPTRRAWPSSKDSATCDAKGQSVPWRAFDGNVQKPFLGPTRRKQTSPTKGCFRLRGATAISNSHVNKIHFLIAATCDVHLDKMLTECQKSHAALERS